MESRNHGLSRRTKLHSITRNDAHEEIMASLRSQKRYSQSGLANMKHGCFKTLFETLLKHCLILNKIQFD